MTREIWTQVVVSPDAGEGIDADPLFELFHENSKTPRFAHGMPAAEIVRRMQKMWESLPYDQYPVVELPSVAAPVSLSLDEAIRTRHSAPALAPVGVAPAQLATILEYAYGVTRDNADTPYPRPFRTVPSAGGLFPLEIYFHTTAVEDLPSGLYHYNPTRRNLRHLRDGDFSDEIAASLDQWSFAYDASVILFITAAFERSTFKYGERGYRFALLEAGHVAQNVNLAANGLGLGCVNIGGFYDREVDAVLRLDGVSQSTLYMVAIGAELEEGFGTRGVR